MIKDNQKYFNRLLVVIDACVIAGSYSLAFCIKFLSGWLDSYLVLSRLQYFEVLIPVIPGYLLLYHRCRLYSSKRSSSFSEEILGILKANIIGMLIFTVLLFVFKLNHYSRMMIAIFFILNLILEVLFRYLLRVTLRIFRKKGYNKKFVLLVGYSRAAEEYIDRILANPQWGYVVRGILDDQVERGTSYRGVKVLGRIDNLLIILPENKLDEISITLSLNQYGRLEEIVNLCEKSGVHTKFIPDYNSVIPSKPYTEDLQGLPVINIRHVPLTNNINWIIKRIFDIIGSLLCIVLFSPIMLITALIIRLSSKGPVIFKQERVGLHCRKFCMYKFRSMRMPKPGETKDWTTRDDPRVTRFGKLIRKTSIDELPQLFNVLKGDMSLIGPRPEQPAYVEQFKEEIPRYMIKHQVRPGMTGWAQVNGYRGDSSIRGRIEHDLYYIENWTVGLDLKILVLTVFKGFINKNAY